MHFISKNIIFDKQKPLNKIIFNNGLIDDYGKETHWEKFGLSVSLITKDWERRKINLTSCKNYEKEYKRKDK